MKDVTLCLLVKEGSVCLAMKKRGFGEGKWNGVGGKVGEGETIEAAALREMREEIGVGAEELTKVALIDFYFEEEPSWDQRMHVFLIRSWEGEPTESEEMRPQWFAFDEIPYKEMWIDDEYWMPMVLEGKKLKAEFRFLEKGAKLASQKIEETA
jgi:8-oxo-dGTP pyrophosphatase MutT (NUDIX family)